MDERDIWRAANILVEKYGPDAVYRASQRVDEMLGRGDMDGRRVWLRIRAAVEDLLRSHPEGGQYIQ